VNHNPYAPPKANVDDLVGSESAASTVSARMYSSTQMAVASFIGTPIAAAWFAAANFKALGQPRKATQTLLWGLVATAFVIGLALVLPDNTPNTVLPIGYSIGVRVIAERVFGATLKDHASAGGKLGSWWRIVGVSLLFVLALCAVMACVITLLVLSGAMKL